MTVFLAFLTIFLLFSPICTASNASASAAPSGSSSRSTISSQLSLSTGIATAGSIIQISASSISHSLATSLSLVSSVSASSAKGFTTTVANATSTTTSVPTQTVDPATLEEIETIHERRLSSIIGAMSGAQNIGAWLSSLGADGKWPDSEVDYTTGCAARRANWPAQTHWQRILVMAGAWHGGLAGAEQFVKDPTIRDAIASAMHYWFGRDFTDNPNCLDFGGFAQCPCDNPSNTLWNTNWFSNIILIPELVSQTCLLLNDTLSAADLVSCNTMTGRSYGTFDHSINGAGFLTGANTLDVAKIGIDQGLLNVNVSMLTDAFHRIHLELVIEDDVQADGIRPDGSFGQHGGILYNGNYGKDFTNDLLDLEVEASNTQFEASSDSQTAFATLFDGDRWMIYRNADTGVLHWDFSVLGRFISFPVIDDQATGSIKMNLTEIELLGNEWSSTTLIDFATSLSKTTKNANAGHLIGNRQFYNNDYMVHRGPNYVSTVKMFSSRTKNTECTNLQNPLGFHLADGVLHTYLEGNEYEDIAAAWDWNLIPGITIDYGATPLTCDHTQLVGIENFVGGTSDGHIGLSAMRYTNPLTEAFHFQKVWFFLDDDVQHVMIANISSSTNALVRSVLDQRLHSGAILVDGGQAKESFVGIMPQSLWHGSVGYTFPESDAFTLTVQSGEKTGNWSAIGTSTQPPITVDLFAAWLEHKDINVPLSYSAFPGTDIGSFLQKSGQLRLLSIQNDGDISAIFDEKHKVVMAVFWNTPGGSFTFTPDPNSASITITSNSNIALIYKMNAGEVVASDPSQSLIAAQVTLKLGPGKKPVNWGKGVEKSLVIQFPDGGLAGSSVVQALD